MFLTGCGAAAVCPFSAAGPWRKQPKRLAALCGLTFFLPGPFSAVQTPSLASTARAAPVLPSELCLGWNLSF